MCKAPFYDIRILSVKQPITLLSEKPCYEPSTVPTRTAAMTVPMPTLLGL